MKFFDSEAGSATIVADDGEYYIKPTRAGWVDIQYTSELHKKEHLLISRKAWKQIKRAVEEMKMQKQEGE